MLDMEAIKNFSIDKSDWKKVKFGDVVFEPKESVKDPVHEGVEHVVGLEHISSEDIHLRRSAGIEESTTFTKKFSNGDVLFGRRRAYLKKAARASFDGICSGDITVMRVKEELLLPGLLPFIVNNDNFFDYAITHSAGGLSPRVKFKDLANFELLLPSLSSQIELLSLLQSLNSISEKKRKLVAELQRYQAVFFENEKKKDPNNRVKLRDVLEDIIAGKSPKGLSRPATEDEFAVLKVSSVGDGQYVQTENKVLVNQSDFKPQYEVKKGFILITRANALVSGVGRPCTVSKTRKGLMLSDKTLRLIPKAAVIRERFLYQLLRTKEYRAYVESVAGGTEAKNISQKLLFAAPAWLPPLHQQDILVKKLISLDNAINESQSILLKLAALKTAFDTKVL